MAKPAAPGEVCDKCGQVHPGCTAHPRQDGPLRPCMYKCFPGRACRLHGGGSRKVKDAINYRNTYEAAERAMAVYGTPRKIGPIELLLEEIEHSAGHVEWLRGEVQKVGQDALTWSVVEEVDKRATEFTGTDTIRRAVPAVIVDLYYRERTHLVALCTAAIKSGLEERRVRLAESTGVAVAGAVRNILNDLQLTPAQWALVPEVVPPHLRALAAAPTIDAVPAVTV